MSSPLIRILVSNLKQRIIFKKVNNLELKTLLVKEYEVENFYLILLNMKINNELPDELKNTFKTYEEYKNWCINESKKILERAFEEKQ